MTDRAYARISLDTAASGSITKQRSRLARHAYDEPVWYVDESVSGSKIPFAERPAGGELMRDLQRGDRVLVTKIDRAARNVRDLLDIVERIEKAGASIVFIDQNIDTAGPMGRFLLTLLGAVAELEAAILAERRRESLVSFREEGRHAQGRAPYGLRSEPNPNGRGLVLRPDPETAPRLRRAVERVLDGVPLRTITRELGVMGETSLGRLLRNDRLVGVTSIGPEGARIDEAQAIFTAAEWDRLQTYLGRPDKAWSRASGYAAALVCGVCGDRLYANVHKSDPALTMYRCRRKNHVEGSPSASVTRRLADPHVESEFLSRFGALPVTEMVETGNSAARDEAVARARMHLEAIKTQQDAAETDEEEELLFDAYRKAKRALRDAEAMPTERVITEVETGESVAEAWASGDDELRASLLLSFGPFVVEPGRGLSIEKKVHLPEREPDYLAGQL